MAIDISLEQFTQAVKENDERNNVLETNSGDKVKVVRPKTQGDAILDLFRRDLNLLGFSMAFDIVNKQRKDKGLKPLTEDDLD